MFYSILLHQPCNRASNSMWCSFICSMWLTITLNIVLLHSKEINFSRESTNLIISTFHYRKIGTPLSWYGSLLSDLNIDLNQSNIRIRWSTLRTLITFSEALSLQKRTKVKIHRKKIPADLIFPWNDLNSANRHEIAHGSYSTDQVIALDEYVTVLIKEFE